MDFHITQWHWTVFRAKISQVCLFVSTASQGEPDPSLHKAFEATRLLSARPGAKLEVSLFYMSLSISQYESQGHAAFGRIRSWINSPGSNWFSGWLLQAQLPKVLRVDTQQQFCRPAKELSLQAAKHREMFCFLPISRKLPPLVWTANRSNWITAGTPRDCLSFLSHPFCQTGLCSGGPRSISAIVVRRGIWAGLSTAGDFPPRRYKHQSGTEAPLPINHLKISLCAEVVWPQGWSSSWAPPSALVGLWSPSEETATKVPLSGKSLFKPCIHYPFKNRTTFSLNM